MVGEKSAVQGFRAAGPAGKKCAPARLPRAGWLAHPHRVQPWGCLEKELGRRGRHKLGLAPIWDGAQFTPPAPKNPCMPPLPYGMP